MIMSKLELKNKKFIISAAADGIGFVIANKKVDIKSCNKLSVWSFPTFFWLFLLERTSRVLAASNSKTIPPIVRRLDWWSTIQSWTALTPNAAIAP